MRFPLPRDAGRGCRGSAATEAAEGPYNPLPAHAFEEFAARPSAYTSFTFFSGSSRTGLPVAAWIALSTAGATTQIVGSPTPPQKS